MIYTIEDPLNPSSVFVYKGVKVSWFYSEGKIVVRDLDENCPIGVIVRNDLSVYKGGEMFKIVDSERVLIGSFCYTNSFNRAQISLNSGEKVSGNPLEILVDEYLKPFLRADQLIKI
jgi:hypothetical protein